MLSHQGDDSIFARLPNKGIAISKQGWEQLSLPIHCQRFRPDTGSLAGAGPWLKRPLQN
jgi:hypothetical protein